MSLETALRLTEALMAMAFAQHSAEHLAGPRRERWVFGLRLALSMALFLSVLVHGTTLGQGAPWILAGLVLLALVALHLFQGPYNGGSDRMGLLILICLFAIAWVPSHTAQEVIFAYLGFQLMMSYLISGWVKLRNPDWRSGRALADVFAFSAYPVSEGLRGWSAAPMRMLALSWAVIAFEVLFPLAFFTQVTLIIALSCAACFHFANACLFGLNRFFWIWLAAYPSILWLHDRVL